MFHDFICVGLEYGKKNRWLSNHRNATLFAIGRENGLERVIVVGNGFATISHRSWDGSGSMESASATAIFKIGTL